MTKAQARLSFLAGVMLFIAAKLYLVLPTTAALAVPRLGDDALGYLWRGQLFELAYRNDHPALADLLEQYFLDDAPSDSVALMRSAVTFRMLGMVTPAHDVLMWGTMAIAPDLRWAFALAETVGVVAMAAGMGWFLLELCGMAAAGVAMALMAFAILPNQGVYSFIPSTLALSCGLLLWAYLWRRGQSTSAWALFVAALPILGMHPVAKAYVALSPIVLWVRLGHLGAWRQPVLRRVAATCSMAVGVSLLVPVLFPQLRPPPSILMGAFGLWEGFRANLSAVGPLLLDPVLRKNVLWALLLAGALLVAPRASLTRHLAILLLGIAGLLAASLFFVLPGYPAEVFTRFWVLFALIGAGAGGRFAVHLLDAGGRKRKAALLLLSGGLLISTLMWVISYVPATMNWRNEVLDEGPVRRRLEALPPGSTLLYAEVPVALPYALLAGGYRFGALAYPMLGEKRGLERMIAERRPAAIVTPVPTTLNSLAERRSKSFVHRRHGLYFRIVEQFVVMRGTGAPLGDLSLFVENRDTPTSLSWQPFDGEGRALAPRQEAPVAGGAQWLSLKVPPASATVSIVLPDTGAWLLGINAGTPTPHVLWPWKAGWTLSYSFRGKSDRPVQVVFTPQAALERVRATELLPYVDAADPIIADDGGLLFLRTVSPKQPSVAAGREQ